MKRYPSLRTIPPKLLLFLVFGWLLVAAKVAVVPLLISRWQVPVAPGWIIVPTLGMATIVTLFAIFHDWRRDV